MSNQDLAPIRRTAQARAASKLRAWSRDGKIGRGRLSRSYAAATKKSSRPCAFVRSSLHAACRTYVKLTGQPSRPSNQARPAAALHRAPART